VLRQVFHDLRERFQSQDQGTRDAVLDEIMAAIKSMPLDQQERLQRELHVEELTRDALQKAILAGTLGTALAVVVEVAGFSAYVAAVKLLASVASILGVTLPFSAYVTLTSTLAFLSNPAIVAAAVLGLGWFLTEYANGKIRDSLVPIIATQAIVSSSLDGDVEENLRPFLVAYSHSVGAGQRPR